jgi:hypothetical protein
MRRIRISCFLKCDRSTLLPEEGGSGFLRNIVCLLKYKALYLNRLYFHYQKRRGVTKGPVYFFVGLNPDGICPLAEKSDSVTKQGSLECKTD